MNRKMLALPPVIALSASMLVACGGSVAGGGQEDSIVVGTTDKFVASKEVPAPLDPAYAYEYGSWNILRQTLQTLLVLPRGGGDPVPEAADQCAFADTRDERYVCRLRPDLTFSDGTPVTADDVKYSIDRVRKINAHTGVSGLLSTIDTVETQGNKVIFHLKTPDATFPYKLATPAAAIVEPGAYARNRLRPGFEVNGSGPYKLKAVVKNGTMVKAVFTRNASYTGGLQAKNDKVELRSYPENPDAMGKALEKGDIDLATHSMTPEQIAKYSANPVNSDNHVNLVESPGLQIGFLGFNTHAPAVRNKAVRQAMAQLVDRGSLAAKVFGATAQPLYSVVPSTIAGHANAFFNKYGEPSVTKARALLDGANISTPVKLTLHYTTDHYGPSEKKLFAQLETQLNASGLFDVTIEGAKWNEYRATQLKGSYPVYGLGWSPDFPDADNFVAPFLDKDNALGSTYVNSRIRNELIPASRRETDRGNVSRTITQIQDIVAEDVPILPLWQGKQYVAARDDIQGAEWALDISSNLRLWELSRGMGD